MSAFCWLYRMWAMPLPFPSLKHTTGWSRTGAHCGLLRTLLCDSPAKSHGLILVPCSFATVVLLPLADLRMVWFRYTHNPTRRLRSHNGEITGGPASTAAIRPLDFVAIIYGFSSQREAMRVSSNHHILVGSLKLLRLSTIMAVAVRAASYCPP